MLLQRLFDECVVVAAYRQVGDVRLFLPFGFFRPLGRGLNPFGTALFGRRNASAWKPERSADSDSYFYQP